MAQTAQKSQYNNQAQEEGRKIFIGNLSWNLGENQIRKLAEEFGTVEDCHLVLDRATQRSRGFAFVTFGTKEEAQAAIKGLEGKEVDGREIHASKAQPKKGQ